MFASCVKTTERRYRVLISEIINGNSLEELPSILRKYRGRKMIIVTDPPFNVGYKYRTYKDNMDEEDYYEMLGEIFTPLPFVVIHYPESIYKIAFQVREFPDKVVSWVYNSNTAKQHRDIAFFGVKPDFTKVRQPYKNPNDKRIKERMARGIRGGGGYTTGGILTRLKMLIRTRWITLAKCL